MKRVDPSEEDVAEFMGLLAKVPTEVIERRVWETPEGEALITALFRYQRKGGRVNQLEEALGVGQGYLALRQRRARDRAARQRNAKRRARNG